MYVIVEAGGRQWKLEPGSQLDINRVSTEVGATHTLERVLLAHDGTQAQFGRPYLKDTKVVCEVLAHPRGPKRIAGFDQLGGSSSRSHLEQTASLMNGP